VARDDRSHPLSLFEHERRALLARRAFALELDNVSTAAQRSTRKLLPLVYGVAAFGALLGIVAIARLTRKTPTALVRISLPRTSAPTRSPFMETVLRGPITRGLARSLARVALRRLASSRRLGMGPFVPLLTSAATAFASFQDWHEPSVAESRRGGARRP
jgi:hypothetical protein